MEASKEEWREWLEHPCTREFVGWLSGEVSVLTNSLVLDMSHDETQTARGKVKEASYILDTTINKGKEE